MRQRVDEGAAVVVRVISDGSAKVLLALSCLLVELGASLGDVVFVLLIVVVLVLLFAGLLARDALIADERFLGVGKGVSVVDGLVESILCGEGACLLDEKTEQDGVSVGRAVGTKEELQLLLSFLLLLVPVLSVVVTIFPVATALIVVFAPLVLFERLLIEINFLALEGLLEIELLLRYIFARSE